MKHILGRFIFGMQFTVVWDNILVLPSTSLWRRYTACCWVCSRHGAQQRWVVMEWSWNAHPTNTVTLGAGDGQEGTTAETHYVIVLDVIRTIMCWLSVQRLREGGSAACVMDVSQWRWHNWNFGTRTVKEPAIYITRTETVRTELPEVLRDDHRHPYP
jgi:hypothetical protein